MDLHIVGETNLELKVKESLKNRIWTRVIVVKDLNKPFILSGMLRSRMTLTETQDWE